jgi:hypothetical protein
VNDAVRVPLAFCVAPITEIDDPMKLKVRDEPGKLEPEAVLRYGLPVGYSRFVDFVQPVLE